MNTLWRALVGAVILLMLCLTFAWYFQGFVMFDLAQLWAWCT